MLVITRTQSSFQTETLVWSVCYGILAACYGILGRRPHHTVSQALPTSAVMVRCERSEPRTMTRATQTPASRVILRGPHRSQVYAGCVCYGGRLIRIRSTYRHHVSRAQRSTKRREAPRSGALQTRDRHGLGAAAEPLAVPDQQCTTEREASGINPRAFQALRAALHPGHNRCFHSQRAAAPVGNSGRRSGFSDAVGLALCLRQSPAGVLDAWIQASATQHPGGGPQVGAVNQCLPRAQPRASAGLRG
jgi:hypothetical protein